LESGFVITGISLTQQFLENEENMKRHFSHGQHCFYFLLMFVVTLKIFGLATMFLWNTLMTTLFHLPVIDFWQVLGLLVLSRLLVGGIGSHTHALMHFSHHRRCGRDFHNQMRERWDEMKPDERAKLQEKFHKSERTGININTLLSRKRYAVQHLRERLQDIRDAILEK
jgi:hypothetical protein